MFTTDLSLKEDPAYREISLRFKENPEEFELAFAKAWFKLTHRDMGPKARYIGSAVPAEELLWQDLVPAVDHEPIDAADIAELKSTILASGLTVPEMTVLVGGMRALDANAGQSGHGVFTDRPGTLSNDFFVNLLDMSTQWSKSLASEGVYEGRDRGTGELEWMASLVDPIFGSNSELRAIAEVYAADDAREKFVQDFVNAWAKVMTLDQFDS